MQEDSGTIKKKEIVSEKKDESKHEQPAQEKHLTSDVHIRYRGHQSELVHNKEEHFDTNMTGKDIHSKNKEDKEDKEETK